MLAYWTPGPLELPAIIFIAMLVVIQVAILRWVFRINKIVDVLTDQASLLEDIKESIEKIVPNQDISVNKNKD